MKKFKYEAIDAKGNSDEGILQASNFEEVLFKLLKSQRYPMRIEELNQHNLITLGRLEKMKQLRSRLQPEEIATNTVADNHPKVVSKTKWLVPMLIVLWTAVLTAYIISVAF